MRAIILAVLVAAGIGLVGASNVSAAPVSGAVIGETAAQNSNLTTVRYWRRHHRRDRCHWRHRSSWYRC